MGAIIAVPFGLIALRVRRHTFVVITIAIFFIFQLMAFNLSFTGGNQGVSSPFFLWSAADYNNPFYYVALIIAVGSIVLAWLIRNSRFGLQLRAIRDATSPDDLFERLEDAGTLLRIDAEVRPTMYRCATVTGAELEQLRRIDDIVRMGHLLRIEAGKMVLDGGEVPTRDRLLYVDCTADGAEKRPATAIFDGGRITLQSVRGCQQIFSASLIAHVEGAYPDDASKNELCVPLPHPDTDLDWVRVALADYGNQLRWFDDAELSAWLWGGRLDFFGHLVGQLLPPASAKPRVRERLLGLAKTVLSATAAKLDELVLDEAFIAAP